VLERLGQLYVGLQLQRYAEAVAIYERLLEHVDRPYTRFRLAVAIGLDGNYKRSIQLLESVRAERPGAVVVYSKLGWCRHRSPRVPFPPVTPVPGPQGDVGQEVARGAWRLEACRRAR
jgi:tetratricopeptide (TPR) repeat protein